MTYLAYDPDLEERDDDEGKVFEEIAETFAKMGQQVAKNEGHPKRVSHAKSTGVLKGYLEIDRDLPSELAQGLFLRPGRYEAIARLAQGPGETLADRVSTHRGLAVKVLSVPGERISEDPSGTSQDWVCEAKETAFINATAKDFLLNLKVGVANAPRLPEGMKAAVSDVARATNSALEALGGESKILGFFGHAPVHPLSEPYFSQAPIRWGGFVAKLGFYPTEETLALVGNADLDNKHDDEAFRHAVVSYFADHGAEFELRVQLSTDGDRMPIENASKRWPEEESPYRPVGRLVLPPQTWTEARVRYFNDQVSFRPAHSLEAHRPLGQVMRARLFVYERLVTLRQTETSTASAEPRTLSDVPD